MNCHLACLAFANQFPTAAPSHALVHSLPPYKYHKKSSTYILFLCQPLIVQFTRMMLLLLVQSLMLCQPVLSGPAIPRPDHTEHARLARWLTHSNDWGTLATTGKTKPLPLPHASTNDLTTPTATSLSKHAASTLCFRALLRCKFVIQVTVNCIPQTPQPHAF